VPGARLNDDLLLDDSIRRQIVGKYPLIAPILDDVQLRGQFAAANTRADVAKRRSQLFGFVAVVLAVVAIGAAAAEPLWRALAEPGPRIIGISTGLLGVVSATLAAGGVLHGSRKRQWLKDRYLAERLRQFHFQLLLSAIPRLEELMSATDRDAVERFAKCRRHALNELLLRHAGHADAEMSNLLDSAELPSPWLFANGAEPHPAVSVDTDSGELFQAYRQLRLEAQIDHCDFKLRRFGGGFIFLELPMRAQQRLLAGVWLFAFSALVFVHVAIVGSNLVLQKPLDSPAVPAMVVMLALVALAAKTMQEGLALPREIERYEDYRAALRLLRDRFDRATSDADRVHVMVETERLSFEEMRSFLRAHHESSFVL
jgi:hypothetical protein